MVKETAYLSLEDSVTKTLEAHWRKSVEPFRGQLKKLANEGKFDEAHAAIDKFDIQGLVKKDHARLEELFVSSCLFGAHNCAGTLQDTAFVKGTKALPLDLKHALAQLVTMVETDGANLIRKSLHSAVRAEEIKLKKDGDGDSDAPGSEEGTMSDNDLNSGGKATPQQGLGVYPVGHTHSHGKKKKRRRRKEDAVLAERLVETLEEAGESVLELSANLLVSRLVSLGFLLEAAQRGVTTYRVNEVLDGKTCPVCQYMHGREFKVADELSRVSQVLGAANPQELKILSPWPSQSKAGLERLAGMSASELQMNGYGSPPYHPGCRGLITLASKVEADLPFGTAALALLFPQSGVSGEAVSTASTVSDPDQDLVTTDDLYDMIGQISDTSARQKAYAAFDRKDYAEVKQLLIDNGVRV